MNSSEETTENVGMGGNKDERQTTSKDETDESSSENQRNEQRQRQMDCEKEDSRFECNICLDMAKDAVVSMCGHLFCWPCLFQWMDTRPYRQLCPVCKSAISKDKVIPLYGRGGGDSDPREKIPPRPQGQRTEETNQGFPGMFHWGGDNGGHGGGGVQFSTPISLWPTNFVRHGSAMSILCLGKVADVYLIDEPSAYLDFEQRLHAAKGIKRKKSGFIVEHDFIMSTYLADRVIVFDGPQPLVNGMNRFLSQQNITFRRDNASHRPRMNKLNSQLDVDQKTSQNYFYLDN